MKPPRVRWNTTEARVERFVYAASSAAYGDHAALPRVEAHVGRPLSPYAATKIAADQLAYSFHASFGLPVVIARPFNTYGPRQSARAVIPTIITQVASGRREVRLGALSPTRDFTYVSNVVDGVLRACEAREASGEVINVATGGRISLNELFRRESFRIFFSQISLRLNVEDGTDVRKKERIEPNRLILT